MNLRWMGACCRDRKARQPRSERRLWPRKLSRSSVYTVTLPETGKPPVSGSAGEWKGRGVQGREAASAGRPIVATAAGGSGEIVVDGVTGLLVPIEDLAALTGGLHRYHERRGASLDELRVTVPISIGTVAMRPQSDNATGTTCDLKSRK